MSTSAPPGASVPAARRSGRPGWRDPRILLGVLVVAGSVLAGAALLGSGQQQSVVWAAARDLPAGARVSADALVQRAVHFADPDDLGLYAVGRAPVGRVLSRPVGAGELLPRAALGGAQRHLVEVPLQADVDDVPATVREGSRVDVWVAPRDSAASDAPRARRVLADVVVVRLPPAGAGLAPENTRQVIVAVAPRTGLEDALTAASSGRVIVTRRG